MLILQDCMISEAINCINLNIFGRFQNFFFIYYLPFVVEYNPSLPKIGLIINNARIFLLVDLREKNQIYGRGTKKSSENDQSIIKKYIFFLYSLFFIFFQYLENKQ